MQKSICQALTKLHRLQASHIRLPAFAAKDVPFLSLRYEAADVLIHIGKESAEADITEAVTGIV